MRFEKKKEKPFICFRILFLAIIEVSFSKFFLSYLDMTQLATNFSNSLLQMAFAFTVGFEEHFKIHQMSFQCLRKRRRNN